MARTVLWLIPALLLGVLVALPVFVSPKLDPDDYRYLLLAQKLRADFLGNFVEASAVRNSWDHLWWVEEGARVQYFRPTVVLSYLLDLCVHGGSISGYFLTNLLIHLCVITLVYCLLQRLFNALWPSALGALLFAGMYCHGETLNYVAGRTDSMAGMFFIAGLLAHTHFRSSNKVSYSLLAMLFYFFALLTKELTVFLPVVCLFYDHWIFGYKRRSFGLYLCYFLILCGVLLLHSLLMPPFDSSIEPPYFVSLNLHEFFTHSLRGAALYTLNIFWATYTPPFASNLALGVNQVLKLSISTGLMAFALYRTRRNPLLYLALLLLASTWLPTLIVYSSERYLYLPSLALVIISLLLILDIKETKQIRLYYFALMLLSFWIISQTLALMHKNEALASAQPPYEKYPEIYRRMLSPFSANLAGVKMLYLIGAPGDFVQLQLIEPTIQALLNRPDLSVRVLLPSSPATPVINLKELGSSGGASQIELSASPYLIRFDNSLFLQPKAAVRRSIKSGQLGFEVSSSSVDHLGVKSLSFTLDPLVSDYALVMFEAERSNAPLPERWSKGTAKLIKKHPS